jgi:acetyltransferase-like isoleucine patch superfamily enzyme
MAAQARVALAIGWLVLTETLILGVAALPAIAGWQALARWQDASPLLRAGVASAMLVPALIVFAVLLLALTALACRVMRWRTPTDATLVLAEFAWPLLRWGCYAACTHVAMVLVGTLLRASFIWSWFLRANGARVGRGVYVNTVRMYDHNLLEFGDGVVVGSDVHLSGHTVEHGRLVTGPVRLGAGVVIGIGSVIANDVVIGAGAHVGALSLVPRHARLDAGGAYGGVPVRRLHLRP